MGEKRYLHVTYCDDIREEVSGKHSLIGCYGGELIVHRLPVVLPKLCLRLEAMTTVEHPFKKLHLRVYHDDDLVADADITDQLAGMKPSPLSGASWQAVQLIVMLSPFTISAEGWLRAEAETESETLRAGRLRLREREGANALDGAPSTSERKPRPIAKKRQPAGKAASRGET